MRPRKITADKCLTCRTPLMLLPVHERGRLAVHRMEHRREDRRRAQWRAYNERKQQRPNVAGYLHELSCKGRHVTRRKGCTPIPVYRGEPA